MVAVPLRTGPGPLEARVTGTRRPWRLRAVEALDDLEPRARAFLPRPVFAYVSGATERDASNADTRAALAGLGFVTQVLRGVSERDAGVELLGQRWRQPFGIAPMGMSALAAYRGDLALAKAAGAAGIPMVVSGTGLVRLEDVKAENPDAWFQAYVPGDRESIAGLLDRVAAAGYRRLVVTVDLPVPCNPEHYRRAGFSSPVRPRPRLFWDGALRPAWSIGVFMRTLLTHGMPHFENSGAGRGAPILARRAAREFGRRAHLDWSHLAFIRTRWQGQLIVKGMTAAEDVRTAAEEGADAAWLSNHGGRQLDGAVSPLRTIAEARALCPKLPLILDSGLRRGTDILKAVALGADFVFIGRPFLYAAALGGAAGVTQAVNILAEEVDRDMALLGIRRLSEMTADRLVRLGAGAPVALPQPQLQPLALSDGVSPSVSGA
ncbi:MAG: alpha-hydroxy-acid oxidizing protein [Pikeienuella sp.]